MSNSSAKLAPVVLGLVVAILATLRPGGEARADGASNLAPIPDGTGGPSSLALPAASPDSGEALATTDLSTGAAHAHFTFDLPPARGEVQPSLGLTYSSDRSTGLAGVGWTLDLPSITRKGVAGIPRFQDPDFSLGTRLEADPLHDDYLIDGELLVPICKIGICALLSGDVPPASIAGVSLSGYTYFRRRIDNGTRYYFSPDGQTWIQQFKSGRVRIFGAAPDGDLLGPPQSVGSGAGAAAVERPSQSNLTNQYGSVSASELRANFRWNLARDIDVSGNTVYYEYTNNSDMVSQAVLASQHGLQYSYLSDIYDTLAPGQSLAPAAFAHHVHLTWRQATEPLSPAVIPSPTIWRAAPFAQLLSVEVMSATWSSTTQQSLRRYDLDYGQNTWDTRNYLDAITLGVGCQRQLGDFGPGVPAITCAQELQLRQFSYSPDAPRNIDGTPQILDTVSVANAQWGPWDEFRGAPVTTTFVDVDGDARADMVFGPGDANGDGFTNGVNPDRVFVVKSPLPPGPSGGVRSLLFSPSNPRGLNALFGEKQTGTPSPQLDVYPQAPHMVFGDWLANGQVNWLWMNIDVGNSELLRSEIYSPTPSGLTFQGLAIIGGRYHGPNANDDGKWTDLEFSRGIDFDGDGLTDMALVPETLDLIPNDINAQSIPQWGFVTIRNHSGATAPFALQMGPGTEMSVLDPQNYCADGARAMMDVNGDGLADVVILCRELPTHHNTAIDVRAFLNTGDGGFEDVGVVGAISPVGSDSFASSLITVGDLNGDGFGDIAILNGEGIHMCLRQGNAPTGSGWSCATKTFQDLQNLGWINPTSCLDPSVGLTLNSAVTMEIADVDGTGIPRLIVFSTCGLQYGSFRVGMDRPRQGLLTNVKALGGLQTTIAYDSLTHLGLKSPVPAWVVTKTTATNGLGGSQRRTLTEEYDYEQPTYDPRERQFLGFTRVTEHTLGDASSPGLRRTTTFSTEACSTPRACTQLIDYSWFHAVRGLPIVVNDEDDSSGVDLRTTVNRFTINRMYTGLDGTSVLHEWRSDTSTYLWNPGPGTPTNLSVFAGDEIPYAATALHLGGAVQTFAAVQLPVVGKQVEQAVDEDILGNVRQSTDFGALGTDAPITTHRTWALPDGDQTGWSYRVKTEILGFGSSTPREYHYTYDPLGRIQTVSALLSGTIPLTRSNLGGEVAPPPADASAAETHAVALATITRDSFGNVTSVAAPNGRCTGTEYDPLFQQFPTARFAYLGGCGSADRLTTVLKFDRGLGKVTSSLTQAAELTMFSYEPLFGRLAEVDQQDAALPNMTSAAPAVKVDYTDTGSIRLVHVQTVEGPPESPFFVDHYRYIDGFGDILAMLDRAGRVTDGAPTWIVSGAHNRYSNGLLRQSFKPFFWTATSGAQFDPQSFAFTAPSQTFTYDALGETLTSTDYAGHTTRLTYNPASLSVVIRDPEQTVGDHRGSQTTIFADGHGRTAKTVAHLVNGPDGTSGDLATQATYQSTGEVTQISQVLNGRTIYTRTMAYDSIGRMVSNREPNTDGGGLGDWRYAFNDNGELAGTSDARGCGENFIRDTLGRLVAEDYSPCSLDQAAYTPLQPSGDGSEALNVFDPASGRLTNVYDRAAHTEYTYDARGRIRSLRRTVATPFGSPTLQTRYATHLFTKSFSYLESNRVNTASTGADAPLFQVEGNSYVQPSYLLQGTIAAVATSYGELVQGQRFDASGALTHRVFGDLAQTAVDIGYDNNANVQTYRIARGPGPWASVYVNLPPVQSDPENTFQGELANQVFHYDRVNNLQLVSDSVPVQQWPLGARPVVGRAYTYGDDYRLRSASFSYGGARNGALLKNAPSPGRGGGGVGVSGAKSDPFVSPYAVSDGDTYPPMLSVPPDRVQSQTFLYDWRGNTTSSNDDAGDFPNRSIGTVVVGGSYFAGGGNTDQLVNASSLTNAARINALYDSAGHLTSWALLDGSGNPAQIFTYQWDEVGRLAAAFRQDFEGDSAFVGESFSYSAGGARVSTVRQDGEQTTPTYSIRVFDSLKLSGTTFNQEADSTSGDYVADESTEQVYLSAGGEILAHVAYDTAHAIPAANDNGSADPYLHTFYMSRTPSARPRPSSTAGRARSSSARPTRRTATLRATTGPCDGEASGSRFAIQGTKMTLRWGSSTSERGTMRRSFRGGSVLTH
jgi:YD repeat-containing protein